MSDAERGKRIREAAREIGTSDDPGDFERAFKSVVKTRVEDPKSKRSISPNKR